jgi:hypothetical protein
MARFEVMYKVYDDATRRTVTGPSHYTIVVEAPSQPVAEQQVRNMNGGNERCLIQRCMLVG